MKRIMLLISSIAAMSLLACAHGMMRGSVAMKVSENEAHVCLGDKDAKVGDKVNIYKNECNPKNFCHKVKLGEGKVTQLLNEHYSVVQFEEGVPFGEGTVVEIQ